MAEDLNTYLVGKRFPNRLFVGGLPPTVSATELAIFFKVFSSVIDAKVICDDQGVSKGYGFVTFRTLKDVKRVCQMGTLFLRGKKINIGPAVKKEGPTISPEVVIVPSAPSKGEFYYPACTNIMPQMPTPSYSYPAPDYYIVPIETQQYSYYYYNMEGSAIAPYSSSLNQVPYNQMVCNTETSAVERIPKKTRRANNLPPRFKTKRSH